MKIYPKNVFRSLFIAGFILSLLICSPAQSKKIRQPRWNFKKYQAETIDYAKKYPVSNIQPEMPRMSFAAWFQKVVGANRKVKWELADCGLKNSVSEISTGQDLPMCVETSARITSAIFLDIYIEYGTFEQGITGRKPVVRHIFIRDDDGSGAASVKNLRNLPKNIKAIKKSLAFFDPNHGDFEISGEKAAGFEDFSSIWFQTLEYGEYFAVKNFGDLEAGEKHYHLRNIFFDGKSWSFETEIIDGVSYQFTGKFAGHIVETYGAGDADNKALHGHLIKFVNGKKAAEADLFLNFYRLGDAG
jgi:hypothetical protein